MKRWVYGFTDPLPAEAGEARALLGGKGASLADMSRAGLRVPPGFTITTEACRYFFEHQQTWPPALADQVREHLHRLEQATGRRFGCGQNPLLVSVRSGAAVSMPGMMDTILNCGLHPALAGEGGDTPRFWEVYRQFLVRFAGTVDGLPGETFANPGQTAPVTRHEMERCLEQYRQHTGRAFPTDPWTMLQECINAVFRSWHSARALAYRKRNRIEGLSGTAVNVQAMFPSQVSGVLFTQDPNHLEANRLVVESTYGLGEAVVSGEVTPDRFLVQRDNLSAIETFPSNNSVGSAGAPPAPVGVLADGTSSPPSASNHPPPPEPPAAEAQHLSLTPSQVSELCALGLRLEQHFGQPMDIEWGWADGQFALLQCRPIRGLEVAREAEACRQAEMARLRALAKGRRRLWVTHNLNETLRHPTPLTWDILQRFMSGNGGFGRMYRDFGYQPSAEVCERGFLELIGGRIYADPERMAQLFWAGWPLSYDLEAVGRDKNALNRAPTKFDPDRIEGGLLLRLPGLVRAILRGARHLKRLQPEAKRRFDEDILPPYLDYVRTKRAQDLAQLSPRQLLAGLDERRARVLDEFGKESLKPGFFGGLALDALESLLGKLLGPAEGASLAATLTLALEGDTTYEQNALLARIARESSPDEPGPAVGKTGGSATSASSPRPVFSQALADFLIQFGHRCSNEMELMEPRWREDATYLHAVLRQLRAGQGRSLEELQRDKAQQRDAAEMNLPETLAQAGGSSMREEIEELARQARALLPYRESGKHYLMMGYELIRQVVLELGRRTGLGQDIFFLHLDELAPGVMNRASSDGAPCETNAAPAVSLEEIARRKLRWQAAQRLDLPEVIDSEHLDTLGQPPPLTDATELKGEPVAAGVATGPVRVIFDPGAAAELGAGYILVCPSTDPGWTPLFLSARGLIVERGGLLSHGAIVARDFGIPAVVFPRATRLLHEGEIVRVDGHHGIISKLKSPPIGASGET